MLKNSITLLIFVLVATTARAQVSTTATVGSSVTWVQEVDHPTKWNCWGSPSETYSGTKKDNKSATYNSGSMAIELDVAGKHVVKTSPVAMKWDSSFSNDQVFKIKLKRTVNAAPPDDHHSMACSNIKWSYNVDSIYSNFETKLKLRVPSHVWAMKLKFGPNTSATGFSFKVKNADSADALTGKEVAFRELDLAALTQYLLVPPGDEIELVYNASDDGHRNQDLELDLEVTLVGSNRCETGFTKFGEPSKDAFAKASLAILGNSVSLQEGLEYFICASQSEKIERLIYGAKSQDVLDLLNAMRTTHEKLIASKPNAMNAKVTSSEFATATASLKNAIFMISSTVADNLLKYCDLVPTIDPMTGAVTREDSRYRRATLVFDRTKHLFTVLVPGYFDTLSENLSVLETSKKTYSGLLQNPAEKRALNALFKVFYSDDRSYIPTLISQWLTEIPDDALIRPYLNAIKQDLKRLTILNARLTKISVEELKHFSSGAPNAISAKPLQAQLERAKRAQLRLFENLVRIETAYGSQGFSAGFLDTAGMITDRFYQPFGLGLAEVANGLLLTADGKSASTLRTNAESLRQCVTF
ncbi:MAG: hypothetical protein EOP05_01060 [Proteobacteria bacterium]|nr:MAG: hypothetical protein EOP05_01060 [Pseudomonadota bacterium]